MQQNGGLLDPAEMRTYTSSCFIWFDENIIKFNPNETQTGLEAANKEFRYVEPVS